MRAVGLVAVALSLAAAACGSDPARPALEPEPTPPVAIDSIARDAGDTLFTQVVAGVAHFCALTRGGRVFCWATNSNGQLGVPALTCPGGPSPCYETSTPVRLRTPIRLRALASDGAFRVCGLDASGEAYCWGGGAPYGAFGAAFSRYGSPWSSARAASSTRRGGHTATPACSSGA